MLHAALDPERRARYARQLVLPEVGPAGQERLSRAAVLVIGAGGVGAPALAYLVAAGVGRVTLLDPGAVARSDLPRQLLYRDEDVARPKAEAARAHLAALNPDADVQARAETFGPGNGREAVRAHDLIIDASDNPATRYLASDACVLERRRLVLAAAVRSSGRVARLAGGQAPCYRCLHPEPPQDGEEVSCAEAGILAPTAGVVGALAAGEALRALAAERPQWSALLVHADLSEGRFLRLTPPRDPDCAACGRAPTVRSLALHARAGGGGEPYPGESPADTSAGGEDGTRGA